jgi:hypothetical protein
MQERLCRELKSKLRGQGIELRKVALKADRAIPWRSTSIWHTLNLQR